eukprot:3549014-Amphidinium_carterae.2
MQADAAFKARSGTRKYIRGAVPSKFAPQGPVTRTPQKTTYIISAPFPAQKMAKARHETSSGKFGSHQPLRPLAGTAGEPIPNANTNLCQPQKQKSQYIQLDIAGRRVRPEGHA